MSEGHSERFAKDTFNMKQDVKFIIWEVDDDLDGYISKDEYISMYKRVISDKDGLEPRQLYNLVTFLMFDKDFQGTVTEEETLQLLFVRHGQDRLNAEIEKLFGKSVKLDHDTEKHITYKEYMDKINKRQLKEHQDYMDALKGVRKKKKNIYSEESTVDDLI